MELINNYQVPEGYKKTEIGVIPEDWDVVSITKATSAIFLGLTAKVDYVNSGGIPLIRATDIASGRLKFSDARTISVRQHKELTRYRRPKKEDVLVSKSGSLGVCAIVDVDRDFSIYESIIVIQSNSLLNSNFLLWLVRDERTQIRIIGEKVGSTVGHLNLEMFRKLLIPLPPLREQKAIAQTLSDVDVLIAELDKLIAKKRNIKTATMQQLLTGKTRLPGFSGEWEVKKLGDVVDFSNGKAHENSILQNGKFIVINSKFISTQGEVKKYSDSCFCSVSTDQIVMVMSDVPNGKAIAKCFYIDKEDKYTLNQRICSLKAITVDSKILFYLIDRNPYYLAFDDGVKQTNLRKEDVLSCPLKLPPTLEEQKAIAQVLSDIDSEITALEKRRAKTQAIKQGMMQELLTGRTRIIDN
jgi:type I restriction enzyme S subunit